MLDWIDNLLLIGIAIVNINYKKLKNSKHLLVFFQKTKTVLCYSMSNIKCFNIIIKSVCESLRYTVKFSNSYIFMDIMEFSICYN